jgi:hypothetical protein
VSSLASNEISSAAPPIFVVGSPRSGTSLFRLILDSHPSIACGPETHILGRMDDAARKFAKQLDRYAFGDDYWHAQYRTFFETFKLDYARRKGKTRWADKTPGYARHLPFITSLFPEAQVVHVIRDARLVTASALDRWGWRRAWEVPNRWVADVSAARTFGAQMSPTQYTEIRFEDLVGDTEGTLRPLFGWFGEEWDPSVLDYDGRGALGGRPGPPAPRRWIRRAQRRHAERWIRSSEHTSIRLRAGSIANSATAETLQRATGYWWPVDSP